MSAVASDRVVSLILAAGPGTRFGGRKQLAVLDGRPLLRHAVEATLRSVTAETTVVLGAYAEEIRGSVELGDVQTIICQDWQLGRRASLRAGIHALRADVDAVVVTLGDEPFLPFSAIDRLCLAREPGVPGLRASYRGQVGHPVLIERELFPLLASPVGGVAPRELLREAGVALIECADLGDPRDVDTVEQLRALERSASLRA